MKAVCPSGASKIWESVGLTLLILDVGRNVSVMFAKPCGSLATRRAVITSDARDAPR